MEEGKEKVVEKIDVEGSEKEEDDDDEKDEALEEGEVID